MPPARGTASPRNSTTVRYMIVTRRLLVMKPQVSDLSIRGELRRTRPPPVVQNRSIAFRAGVEWEGRAFRAVAFRSADVDAGDRARDDQPLDLRGAFEDRVD